METLVKTLSPAEELREWQRQNPKHLAFNPRVRDYFGGRAYYYKGVKEDVPKSEFIGNSILTGKLTSILARFLFTNLPEEFYQVLIGDLEIFFAKEKAVSADIVVYDKRLTGEMVINETFATIPPKIIIEVDVKIDFDRPSQELDYVYKKIQTYLDFGVSEVFWLTTATKKVLHAKPHSDWLTYDFAKGIVIENQICPLNF